MVVEIAHHNHFGLRVFFLQLIDLVPDLFGSIDAARLAFLFAFAAAWPMVDKHIKHVAVGCFEGGKQDVSGLVIAQGAVGSVELFKVCLLYTSRCV